MRQIKLFLLVFSILPLSGLSQENVALEEEMILVGRHEQVRAFTRNRENTAGDPYRPLYHFSAPGNMIHDPNGLCQWQGLYHIFYQYHKGKGVKWGHACSKDLLHWKDLPVAIVPTIEADCFSGQTLVEDDRVIAMYHGTGVGNMIATANDPLLLNWSKNPDNPVIRDWTENYKTSSVLPYRIFDPCIWKEENGYYYSLSGSFQDGEIRVDCIGETVIFRSRDLSHWEYLGPMLLDGYYSDPGEDIAVPNFWPIGNGKHMLLCHSHLRASRGYIGTFDLESARFYPDYHFRVNYGNFRNAGIHAPSATVDEKNRLIAIFNMKEGKPARDWDGVMSLPRVFSLAEDNSLQINPIEEMEGLRFDQKQLDEFVIPANTEINLDGIAGKAMELRAVFQPGKAREIGIKILRSPGSEEYTTIRYYSEGQKPGFIEAYKEERLLSVEVSNASLRDDVRPRMPEMGPVIVGENEPLELRIFIDRSIVEVFANGRQCLSVRVYPQREDSREVSVFSLGNESKLLSFDAWQMHSVWPELKFREGK